MGMGVSRQDTAGTSLADQSALFSAASLPGCHLPPGDGSSPRVTVPRAKTWCEYRPADEAGGPAWGSRHPEAVAQSLTSKSRRRGITRLLRMSALSIRCPQKTTL